jgi:predicted acyltransferase
LTLIGVAAACLAGYWILLMGVAAPGGSAGDLSAEGNLGAWLDRQLMAGHLWRPGWDPEGLLSTLPAIATTLFGSLAGLVLANSARGEPTPAREPQEGMATVRALVRWGAAGCLIGLAWSLVFPINKSLWTSSYAIFTAGLAAIGLAACYWWVDVNGTARRRTLTEPLVALGRNALLLFVLSGLLAKTLIYVKWPDASMSLGRWIFVRLFEPLGPPRVASLLYALANLGLLAIVCWILHRRGRYFTA